MRGRKVDESEKRVTREPSRMDEVERRKKSHDTVTSRSPTIDLNIREATDGVEVAKQVFDLGFSSIYFATGTPSSQFNTAPWIKGVTGKTPPWTATE